jgi:hypothetical protein
MKGITNARLQANMGEIVIARLSQIADLGKAHSALAEQGCRDVIVAGQAVASAISELFGDGSAVVYNDVDAFVLSRPGYAGTIGARIAQDEPRQALLLRTISQVDAELEVDDYGNLTTTYSRVFRMHHSMRDGQLNIILGDYHTQAANYRPVDALRFLSRFDLNCTQVGVRLSDKSLVWTSAFERFLETRELLVQGVATPLHTAMRWAKKKDELAGVFGNDEAAMDLLSAAAFRQEVLYKNASRYGKEENAPVEEHLRPWVESAAPLVFSSKFEEMYKRHASTLSAYFTLKEIPTRRLPLFTLNRRSDPTLPAQALMALPPAALPTYMRACRMFYGKHRSRKLLDVFNALIDKEEGGFSVKNDYRVAVICRDGTQDAFDDQGANDLAFVAKMVDKHSGLSVLAFSGFSHEQMFVMCKTLAELSKQSGPDVFGILDTYTEDALRALCNLSPAELPKGLRDFLEGVKQKLKEIAENATYLLGRPTPSVQVGGYRIKELRSQVDLQIEGEAMRHCVGGYVGSVLSGRCAIFGFVSVDNPKDRATLEVARMGEWSFGGVVESSRLEIVQLRGRCNAQPTDGAIQASNRLICSLQIRSAGVGLVRLPMSACLWLAERLPQTVVLALTSERRIHLSRATGAIKKSLQRLGRRSNNGRDDEDWREGIPF